MNPTPPLFFFGRDYGWIINDLCQGFFFFLFTFWSCVAQTGTSSSTCRRFKQMFHILNQEQLRGVLPTRCSLFSVQSMGACAHSPGWFQVTFFLSLSKRCLIHVQMWVKWWNVLFWIPFLGSRSSGHRHRRLPQPGCGAESGRRGRWPCNLHQGVSVPPDLCQAHRRQHGPCRPRAHGVRRKREHGEELRAAQRKVNCFTDEQLILVFACIVFSKYRLF